MVFDFWCSWKKAHGDAVRQKFWKKTLAKILFFGRGSDFFLTRLRGTNSNKTTHLLTLIIFNRDKDDCFKYLLLIKSFFFSSQYSKRSCCGPSRLNALRAIKSAFWLISKRNNRNTPVLYIWGTPGEKSRELPDRCWVSSLSVSSRYVILIWTRSPPTSKGIRPRDLIITTYIKISFISALYSRVFFFFFFNTPLSWALKSQNYKSRLSWNSLWRPSDR